LSSLRRLSLFDAALGSGGISSLVQCLADEPPAGEAASARPGGSGSGAPPFGCLAELDLCGNGLELAQLEPLLDALSCGAAPALRVCAPQRSCLREVKRRQTPWTLPCSTPHSPAQRCPVLLIAVLWLQRRSVA